MNGNTNLMSHRLSNSNNGGGGVSSQRDLIDSTNNSRRSLMSGGGVGGSSRRLLVEKSPEQKDEEYQKEWVKQASRRIHEHVFYMRKAMEADDLAITLERAAALLSELGDPNSNNHNLNMNNMGMGSSSNNLMNDRNGNSNERYPLNPKSYYELHMRALEEMPNLEELLVSIVADFDDKIMDMDELTNKDDATVIETAETKMNELYQAVQYCPKVVPRLYLQICAGSAYIRRYPGKAKDFLDELTHAVKCVQCPVRGLFLRHYLLQATRDKLPPDSHDFVLTNFIEMNKLWVRIQHLPPPPTSKLSETKEDQRIAMRQSRKKREKERNELRLLVGTNLERLASLPGLTVQLYQESILPTILDQISVCRDALAQAYLMDCIIQVFPDEFHIPTLELFLSVCPKLREKVNVRTILTAIMERLANYYADELLLQQDHTNNDNDEQNLEEGAKRVADILENLYDIFKRCIQSVFDARGPHMPAKEIIRLQTALLNFSLRCDVTNMEHVSECLGTCVSSLQQGGPTKELDSASVEELEKLLSIPLDTLALKVLTLTHYSDLLRFLPWNNRRQVAVVMLKAVQTSNTIFKETHPITQLFQIIVPLLQNEHEVDDYSNDDDSHMDDISANGSIHSDRQDALLGALRSSSKRTMLSRKNSQNSSFNNNSNPELTAMLREEQQLVATVVHLLQSDDVDIQFEMLKIARFFFSKTKNKQIHNITLPPLIFALLHLIERVMQIEFPLDKKDTAEEEEVEEEVEKEVEEKVEGEKETEEKEEEKEVQKDGEDADKEVEKEVKKVEAEAEKEVNEEEKPAPIEGPKVTCRKIFVFLQKTMGMMVGTDAETTFKLYLQVATVADACAQRCEGEAADFSAIAYELMAQAFSVYEEEIADSKTQQRAIISIVGTLLSCKKFDKNDYEALITKATQYAAKLLKKADQCKMVIFCSHLFFTGTEDDPNAYRNPRRVLECLQRSLKIADACTMASPSNVQLFVDVLDRYVYYYEMENPVISSNFVTGLIALVSEHLDSIGVESSPAIKEADHQFQKIVQYILDRKKSPATAEHFEAIKC